MSTLFLRWEILGTKIEKSRRISDDLFASVKKKRIRFINSLIISLIIWDLRAIYFHSVKIIILKIEIAFDRNKEICSSYLNLWYIIGYKY